MTVQTNLAIKTYTGNGVTLNFSIPFRFLANSHIRVSLTPPGGVAVPQVETTNYSIVGAQDANGGTLTMVVPPPVGYTLTIQRNMPFTQLVDYKANDPFPEESAENIADERTMEGQQINEVLSRAITLPPELAGYSGQLPAPQPFYAIRWNAAGTGIENYEITPFTSPSGSNMVGFLQRGVGAVARTVQDKDRERLSVFDFIDSSLHAGIRAGTYLVDVRAQIMNAITACAGGKAKLVFPPGDYYISDSLVITQSALTIEFEGRARLVSTHLTAHIMVIGDGVANVGNVEISGMVCTASVVKTDGAALYLRNGNDIRINDFIAATNIHDGVVFEGGAGQFGYYLDRFLITYFSGDGIRQQIGGGVNCQDIHVSNGLIDANSGGVPAAIGINLLSGGGSYYRFIDILGGANGIIAKPPTGSVVNYSFFDQVLCDTNIGDGWQLDDTGGVVFAWTMSNCWGNTSTAGNGFRSIGSGAGKVRNVQISNCIFANNWLSGVQWDRTDNHKIVDSIVGGNNKSNTAALAGVRVAAGCSNFQITDNSIDNEWFFGIGANQKYGIAVVAGASDNYVITGNVIRNSQTAAILESGTGTNKNTTGNVPALTTYVVPTLLGAWVPFGGTWEDPGYWKDENNIVHLRGAIKTGAVPSQIFTLPAGYIPAKDHVFACITGATLNALAGVTVQSGGQVAVATGASNAFLSLDGISFKAG